MLFCDLCRCSAALHNRPPGCTSEKVEYLTSPDRHLWLPVQIVTQENANGVYARNKEGRAGSLIVSRLMVTSPEEGIASTASQIVGDPLPGLVAEQRLRLKK